LKSLDARTLVAHADAWQAEGRLRERFGGGTREDGGARLSASGLPHARWNSGDLVDAGRFDPAEARAWYATRAFGAGVPWGLRVAAGTPFPHGRKVRALRCMALQPARFVRVPAPDGVRFVSATAADLSSVDVTDATAFEAPVDECTPWNAPHLGAPGFDVALAYADGQAVGTATAVRTDERAGPCVTVFGVGVLAHARGRGIAAAMTTWLVERAFDARVTLAHLNPNHDAAARVYARIGFVETQGLDVYVDL
jgi:GNAT superfamily N-acetyltransferase